MSSTKYAVIRVRGDVDTSREIKDTLSMMRLQQRNACVIMREDQLGMVKKVKDFVAYGEIDAETEKLLAEKRGEKTTDKDGKTTLKRYFRLNSPKKGYGRRGIKRSFNKSGALGYRGTAINDLIKRMI